MTLQINPSDGNIETVTTATEDRLEKVEAGLKFILGHFEESLLWPRTIAVGKKFGIEVYSIADAMYHYKNGCFIDCRISAYPNYTDSYIKRGRVAPSQLLVDIDRKDFDSDEEFELAGKNTYSNFQKLGIEPTWMWTGGGYHFPLSQSVPVLGDLEDFNGFDQPSRKFLEFEEQLLTGGKGDQGHSSTVSFKNMYMRIPGSLNSKYLQLGEDKSQVRVIKSWNEIRYNVGSSLLTQYYIWLQAEKVKDIEDKIRRGRLFDRKHKNCHQRPNKIDWIERLLNKPLDDFREACVVFILVPYLVNIRKLSRLETFNVIKSWLDRCNSLERLHFDADYKINYTIERVGEILPQSRDNLKSKRNLLYTRLRKEGVIYYSR